MKKIILIMAVLAMALSLASCGEKCSICGDNSMSGKEVFGEFVCNDCVKDMKDLTGLN